MYCDYKPRKGYGMINNTIEELKQLSRDEFIQNWQELFKQTPQQTLRREFLIKHLAWEIQAKSTYIKGILQLRFLAPDIVESILNDTQPRDLTMQDILKIKTLDWGKQRVALKY